MNIGNVGNSGLTNNIGKGNRQISKILERLATAQRINRASDDAAGLSISENLRAQFRGLQQAGQNVSQGINVLNIAEGAAGETNNILQRQRELALQSSNGTLNDQQRQALDLEYQALNQELDRVANSTQFNGQNLLNGTDLAAPGGADLQVGPNPTDQLNVNFGNVTTAALGMGGTSIATQAGAQAALSAVDTAVNSVNTVRAGLGTSVNRLESALGTIANQSVNTLGAEATIRDQDMAEGMMDLIRERILGQTQTRTASIYQNISRQTMNDLLG